MIVGNSKVEEQSSLYGNLEALTALLALWATEANLPPLTVNPGPPKPRPLSLEGSFANSKPLFYAP